MSKHRNITNHRLYFNNSQYNQILSIVPGSLFSQDLNYRVTIWWYILFHADGKASLANDPRRHRFIRKISSYLWCLFNWELPRRWQHAGRKAAPHSLQFNSTNIQSAAARRNLFFLVTSIYRIVGEKKKWTKVAKHNILEQKWFQPVKNSQVFKILETDSFCQILRKIQQERVV